MKRAKAFERELAVPSSVNVWSKKIQQKVDHMIPQKVHQTIASALEKGIKQFLSGMQLIETDGKYDGRYNDDSLHDYAIEARRLIEDYRKLASIEGAGTGFGGIIASMVDFPALISIKLKLLQALALLYGYRIESFEERLFILKVFQLQFSGVEQKKRIWNEIKRWEQQPSFNEWEEWETFDWTSFYLEYKQSIELKKLLQIVPGFGAIVGAWANYTFLEELGETAILCYEVRKLQERYDKL